MATGLPTSRRRTVLLTGASGVLGQALLGELADHDLLCLTHRQPIHGHRVRTIHGDLTQPMLGLGARDYAGLAAQVDAIVHCAAVTGFNAGPTATTSLNVGGTAAILELAERAGASLQYVSTAFVARQDVTARPASTQEGARPENYLDSKRAAEQLVRDSGVPTNIIRPSVVIGDSITGQIAQFQGLLMLAGAVLKNALPLLTLPPEAPVDFVPQDLVAGAIGDLLRGGGAGGEYWVTAGRSALPASRLVDLCLEVGAELGLRLDRPRLVSPDVVDRLIRPVFIDPLPDRERRKFDDLVALTALFSTPDPFDCYRTTPDVAYLEAAFAASMRYYAQVKGLVGVREVVA